jgi:nitrite reductase/ring-hydroxylating ferredoxin subunit
MILKKHKLSLMQSFTTEQIIDKGISVGFTYKSFEFSIKGKYNPTDALFNHKDVPHFNHLHANLAGSYGNEGIYYGDVVSFIRYFKFLSFSFPILILMKDDGESRVLETFSFFIFQFLKLNTEKEIPEGGCESKITYYIGAKNKFLLSIFLPFFKKMFKKSFNDYKEDDHPFLNRRAELRENGFYFNKDNISNFSFEDTLNIKKQNCFFDYKSLNDKNQKVTINLENLINDEMKILDDSKILSFQIFKENNNIKIYPLVCPHEGGYLIINNKVGVKFTKQDFKKAKCRVRCNIHNRRFDPIFDINLDDNKNTYQSNMYNLMINKEEIIIELKQDIDKNLNQDWSE